MSSNLQAKIHAGEKTDLIDVANASTYIRNFLQGAPHGKISVMEIGYTPHSIEELEGSRIYLGRSESKFDIKGSDGLNLNRGKNDLIYFGASIQTPKLPSLKSLRSKLSR